MSEKDYEIGYGKPPKTTQFKPGLSGNPKGRPKGARDLASDLADELAEVIVITESGQQKRTSKQRALVKTLVAKSLNGDMRAVNSLLRLFVGITKNAGAEPQSARELSEADKAVIEAFGESFATTRVEPEGRTTK